MNFDFSVVTGKTIHKLLHSDIAGCVEQVRSAYLAHGRGQSINPDSYFMLFPQRPRDRIIALPAYLGSDFNVSGMKWIASYPENVEHGFPRASAVLVLNSYETGYPFACMEASIISAARTAGSAVLGAEWMNGRSRKVASLGIVGNGLIARYVYTFLMELGWEVGEVNLYDTSPADAERFRATVCRPERHRKISCSPDLPTLLRSSELILLATTAGTPHIHDPALFSHCPLVLHVSLRDLAPEILLQSYNIVDDVEHVMKANTSPHLTEKRTGNRAFVTGTLPQLMEGQCQVDRSRPIIFSPFGLGVLDLAVGLWTYQQAKALGEAVRINDFFFEMVR